ncbi:alpha/beta fold hydrolase [Streptomyces sp. NBC_00080]|uniref:thioesterase II family protein n=1 Tax=unclassified Streptomyces TaxID=2593676 RepID=UPI00114E077A|nr:alpha/beta fold hydrolase [Streptomyces sp. SLBN-115]TQJ52597.1 surfactin synthase thioesterase subunit [Streptomyces sp. SLBN-115]
MSVGRWFLGGTEPDATARLFAFPHAGGAGGVYRSWQGRMSPRVHVRPVQYPGHMGRFGEPLITRCGPLAEAATAAVLPETDLPVTLFGHSMGALVAFAVAARLEHEHGVKPAHLIVSGAPAPHLPSRASVNATLPDGELIAWLREMGGSDPSVLADDELLGMLLPVLRADLAVGDTFRPYRGAPLSCPVTVLHGNGDALVDVAELDAWAEHTSGRTQRFALPGGHFYLHEESADAVVRRVLDVIDEQ